MVSMEKISDDQIVVMERYLALSNDQLEAFLASKDCPGLDAGTKDNRPSHYPCVVIIAYMGEGWHEMDFVYAEDFKKE